MAYYCPQRGGRVLQSATARHLSYAGARLNTINYAEAVLASVSESKPVRSQTAKPNGATNIGIPSEETT